MVFSSVIFLNIFFPIVLVIYYTVSRLTDRDATRNRRAKNITLLLASIAFYGAGGYKYLLLLGAVLLINYFGGLATDSLPAGRNRSAMIVAVILDLGLLFCFKYLNLFVLTYENLQLIITGDAAAGWQNLLTLTRTGALSYVDIALPIGISFYIFQSISYVADVYRKEAIVQRNFFDFALYVSFFPQLIAGPIVKYSDIASQIRDRQETLSSVESGITRFIYGLSKKVLIANTVAVIADDIWALEIKGLGASITWLGAICYTLQIYFDFSGYSDMAIGLGRIFGFNFKENFNYPYISGSVQEFWRRWHLSLSTWFKEYVYIPLGGSRCSMAKTIRNIFLVFLLTGIWHGANFTFLVWGLIYALFLIAERLFLRKLLQKKHARIPAHLYTLFVVIIGWVFFRSDHILQAFEFIREMFRTGNGEYSVFSFLSMKGIIAITAGILLSFPIYPAVCARIKNLPTRTQIFWRSAGLVWQFLLLIISITVIVSGSYNPFIYFQF
ncbi:MAG: MBOAT family protein [Lachnospiraceae bacterium]|nr:MBOAT family protein [Lachnospiraceae bacterium]